MTLTRRRFLLLSGAMLCAAPAQAGASDVLQIEGPAFGAGWRVRVAAGADADAIISVVMAVVEQIDGLMSPYRPQSELSRFNRWHSTAPMPLSPATCATLAEARRIAALTDGAFDPTLGGITGRFGFGPLTAPPAGGFADMALVDGAAKKAHPAQTLDLCGIAKGHALDLIMARLADLGHADAFVELGGEVMAQGRHPSGRPWRAAIERPLPGAEAVQARVVINGEALATSGDRANGYDVAGRRFSHIIDPHTQQPVAGALASVSVFAPRASTADALATALFAMGADHGPAFARDAGLAALFMLRQAGGVQTIATGDFARRYAA
ncbi:FAD:protein FMN transferase [Pseudotabrizicola sp. L79]|uniref:FAD:protein FMN transferase n=1 Tax=Pseudotabrizicola sp. L79 TaxID=3118402 RepID=UPI002F928D3A